MTQQLTLFNLQDVCSVTHQPSAKSSQIKWSYSRRSLLEQCPRRYYYQYYGATKRTANTDSHKQTLHLLNKLSNRYLRIGEIAHLVIRTYLTRQQQGEEWTLNRVLRWAQSIYHRDLEYSRQYKQKNLPSFQSSSNNLPAILLEFYYGFDNAEVLWAESEEQLLTALTNFIKSPEFAPLRTGGSQANALIEKRISLKKEHFSIGGQIDLAYPDNDRFAIADWKIGGASGGNDSLQLLSYAFWVREKFSYASDSIDLYQAHLASNQVSPFVVHDKEILRTKARIIQDLEKMRTIDNYGRNGIAEAFTPCGQPRVCNLCPFQESCPKE